MKLSKEEKSEILSLCRRIIKVDDECNSLNQEFQLIQQKCTIIGIVSGLPIFSIFFEGNYIGVKEAIGSLGVIVIFIVFM